MKKILVLFAIMCVSFVFSTTASAMSNSELTASLQNYAVQDLDNMCKHMPDCGGKVEMNKRSDGRWERTYCVLNKDTINVTVKKVGESDNYLGIIKFIKVTYEAVGDSKEAVMQQPFKVVQRNKVTKIRQFKNGKWQ